MIKIENERWVVTDSEGMLVRRVGGSVAGRKVLKFSGESESDFEEVSASEISAERETARREKDYCCKVERLVARKYSLAQEIALLRQRDSKPEEFAEYDEYVEACKAEAKASVNK